MLGDARLNDARSSGSGGGASDFKSLTDVTDYAGHGGEFVVVKAGADGLEYAASSPGGGPLNTAYKGNILDGIENAIELTHAAVPLTDDNKVFSIGYAKANPGYGGSSYIEFNMLTSKNNDLYWLYDNVNTTSASWVNEGAGVGHFSVAVAAKVKLNCFVKLADGNTYRISAFAGDGSGLGSVTLTSDPGANFAVTWVRGGQFTNGIELGTVGGSGPSPIGDWYFCEATIANIYGATLQSIADKFSGFNGTVGRQGANTARAKLMISPDNGVTYYSCNGLTWEVATRADFATKGIEYDFNNYGWYASDGITAMSNPLWQAFNAGSITGCPVRVLIGQYAVDVTDYVYISSLSMYITATSLSIQMPFQAGYGSATQLQCYRLSTTKLLIVNETGNTINNITLTAYTL